MRCERASSPELASLDSPADTAADFAEEVLLPGWGAPKIREKLRQQMTLPHLPATSTVHAVRDRHGLVKRRRRRHHSAAATFL